MKLKPGAQPTLLIFKNLVYWGKLHRSKAESAPHLRWRSKPGNTPRLIEKLEGTTKRILRRFLILEIFPTQAKYH
jgi:hypothetical protein